VVIKIKALGENSIKKYILGRFDIDESLARLYSIFSRGSIGQAEKIAASQEFIDRRMEIINILTSIKNKDAISVFEAQKQLEVYKEDIDHVLDIFYMWYRDIMVLKSTQNEKYVIQKDKIVQLKSAADQLGYESIFSALDTIEDTRYKLGRNANFSLAMELMLLKINKI
jgi:DNA polymerase-3 subunit delta'